jgi:RsiW-degrading membrane proteinase PrsW (M82 family)
MGMPYHPQSPEPEYAPPVNSVPQPLYSAPQPVYGAPQSAPNLPPAAAPAEQANVLQATVIPAIKTFLRSQLPYQYWRVLAVGLAAILITNQVLNSSGNTNMVPLLILLCASLVPVTFIVFCVEHSQAITLPVTDILKAFGTGAILGLILAGVFEASLQADGLIGNYIVAIIEESAKIACIVWFLRDPRLRTEMHGLVLGAAAGMGFDALENAGYGFSQFLNVENVILTHGYTSSQAFFTAIAAMNNTMVGRVITDLPTHGVWTAIVAAAIWRERGNETFRFTPGVMLAFGIAVTLHALWDWEPLTIFDGYLWYILLAIPALLILGFFIREAKQRLNLPPDAPVPPLADELRAYFARLWQRVQTAVPAVAPAGAKAATNAPPPMMYCPTCATWQPALTLSCPYCGTPMQSYTPPPGP